MNTTEDNTRTTLDIFAEKAVTEGKKAASQAVAEVKKANEKIKTELDKRTHLNDDERKMLLTADQEKLSRKLLNELVETRTSIIMLDKAIFTTQARLDQYKLFVNGPGSLDDVVNKARIDVETGELEKMTIQKTYLNTVFAELAKTVTLASSASTMERFKPIESHLRTLLADVDRLQAESDALSQRKVKDPSIDASKKTLEEGTRLIGA
jgi:CRISPR/Cas system CMR-associated protein Cmr5 small subunit